MLSDRVEATFPASAPVAPVSAPIRPGFEALQWGNRGVDESAAKYQGRIEFRRDVCARVVVAFTRDIARGGAIDVGLLATAIRDYDLAEIEYRALLGLESGE